MTKIHMVNDTVFEVEENSRVVRAKINGAMQNHLGNVERMIHFDVIRVDGRELADNDGPIYLNPYNILAISEG